MDISLVSGLLGGGIGILGGVVGTYFSIHNTKTPTERRFVVRAAIWTWLGVFAFLAVLFLIPVASRWLAWLPYAVILPLAIRYMNRRQNAIHESDRNVSPCAAENSSGLSLSLGSLAADMNVLRAIATSVVVVSLSCRIAGAADTGLIDIGSPVLQGKDRLVEAWNHLSTEKRTDIQNYLLSLGLSSTGRIHLIGSFRKANPNGKDRNILQFQQTDLEGSRLFWSVLVDPDSLEAQIIFSLSKEVHYGDFKLFSTKK